MAAPAALATLNETTWEFTDTKTKKPIQELIDATGKYIAVSGTEHIDHGTAVMKDGKACFTSAMDKEGEVCWTDPMLADRPVGRDDQRQGRETDRQAHRLRAADDVAQTSRQAGRTPRPVSRSLRSPLEPVQVVARDVACALADLDPAPAAAALVDPADHARLRRDSGPAASASGLVRMSRGSPGLTIAVRRSLSSVTSIQPCSPSGSSILRQLG